MSILDTLPWKSRSPMPVVGRDETVVRQSRHHWMRYAPLFCTYALLAAVSGGTFLLAATASLPSALAALAALLAVHHWFFYALMSENCTDIILTNKRVLYLRHRLWTSDAMEELVIRKIKLVRVHKEGLIRHILDYGDISCLFDIDAGKTIRVIAGPQVWARKIEEQMSME